jgi:hypothetical protein
MSDNKDRVYERVVKFMIDNRVSCEETIYQTDRVIENAYELMADLYNLVESDVPNPYADEDDE